MMGEDTQGIPTVQFMRRSCGHRNFSIKYNWDSTLNLPQTTFPIRSQLNDDVFRDAVSIKLYERLSSRKANQDFTLIDGPPFANGDLHVGHALNKLLKDTILRLKGQQGYRIEFRPAWDCHGLPIESKALQHHHKTASKQTSDPIEIRNLCRKFALEAVESQKRSMRKWGIMADYTRPLLTMDPKFEANQLRVFSAMVEKDLIYSAKKPVYFSCSSQTALAEAELEYSDDHVSLTVLVRFKAHISDHLRSKLPDKMKNVSFVTWTTTPWTLPSNKALAVGKDIIYSLLYSNVMNEYLIIAKSRIPFICSSLQHSLDTIISDFCMGSDLSTCHYESLQFTPGDSYSINPVLVGDFVTDDSGSGLVHLAPDYGTDDFELCKSVGIGPNQQDFLNDQGDFTYAAPPFLKGSNIFSGASETILEYLKCTGNFLASDYYTHRYPYDWRTKKPVIQRATSQWFASISSILPQLQKSLEEVQFIPEHGKDKMLSMLKNRTDWCISRQRHWGLPIPALQNLKDKSFVLDSKFIDHLANLIESDPSGSDIWWTRPLEDLLNNEKDSESLVKTFDTLDVWFDSGTVWNNFSKYPADLYLEGSDQYRGWFQSSFITSVSANEKSPFKTVLTHGFVLDQKGQKMSKSIGNVVNPDEIVDKYGSDVLRLWVASSNFKNDINIGSDIIKQISENKRKIRNTLRFILANLNGYNDSPSEMNLRRIDSLMLSKLKEFEESCWKSFDSYDFPAVIQQLSRFCVQDLSAFYFEILKDRLYTEPIESPLRQGAQAVLIEILNSIHKIISPLMPFLSEEIKDHLNVTKLVSKLKHEHSIDLKELEMIQRIRSDFLEWFNSKGKIELSVKNTFQLDICVSIPSGFTLNYEDLREIFMVADVNLTETMTGPFEIVSIKASDRHKCPRCWTFNSSIEEELCSRCNEQLTLNQINRINAI